MPGVWTEKLGPLETWKWLGMVTVLGLGLYAWNQHRAATGKAQQTTTSNQKPGISSANVPQFVIQNQFPASEPSAGPAAPPPHVYGNDGHDLGPAMEQYGGAELAYLKQNIGNYGITDSEYQDVVRAYQQVATQHGRDAANAMHFSWIGPGNVQAIPRNTLQVGDILTGLGH